MRTPLVYLAHPIDLARDVFDPSLIHMITGYMFVRMAALYRPSRAYMLPSGARPEPYVSDINNHALHTSHGLIALLPESPSIGVGLEIQQAQTWGVPSLIVVRRSTETRSWALSGLSGAEVYAIPDEDEEWTSEDRNGLEAAVGRLVIRARMQQDLISQPMPRHLQVVKTHPVGQLPFRAYPGDAGFDLHCCEDVTVPVGQFVDVPCGIAAQLPEGTWGFITGRSSTLRKHGLLVNPAVIDQGYRGLLYVGVHNLGDKAFHVKQGMRLAQLVPLPLTAESMQPLWVQELEPSDRGESGFGSSGE